jgi:prephenate dehydrogenase
MKITVIGLGLIGGSIALDLKARGFATRIIGVDNNPAHGKQALDLGIADEIKDLEDALDSEIVILAVPVTQTAKLLPAILDKIGDNTVVIDTGSPNNRSARQLKNTPAENSS